MSGLCFSIFFCSSFALLFLLFAFPASLFSCSCCFSAFPDTFSHQFTIMRMVMLMLMVLLMITLVVLMRLLLPLQLIKMILM